MCNDVAATRLTSDTIVSSLRPSSPSKAMAVGAVVSPTPVSTSSNDVLKSSDPSFKNQKGTDSPDRRSACKQSSPSHAASQQGVKPESTKPSNCTSIPLKENNPLETSSNKPDNPSTNQSTPKPKSSLNIPSSPTQSQPSKPQPKTGTSHVCEGCSESHDGSYGSGRFCSVHCARRIAASRKWEKQRSERKHLAAVAAAAAVAVGASPLAHMEQSTSSLSSASSLDASVARPVPMPHGNAMKRRRVFMMPSVTPHTLHPCSTPTPPPQPLPPHLHQPHPLHAPSPSHALRPDLVHPQPQHYVRPNVLPQAMFAHMSAARPPISATPSPGPFVDYAQMPVRAASPFYFAQQSPYCSYASHPMSYPSPSPQPSPMPSQYPFYGSHHQLPHPPPPPPPTPAPDNTLVGSMGGVSGVTSGTVAEANRLAALGHAPQAQVSTEKECKAVAEALLCLGTSNKKE